MYLHLSINTSKYIYKYVFKFLGLLLLLFYFYSVLLFSLARVSRNGKKMRNTLRICRVSVVPTNISALVASYTPRYAPLRKMNLSTSFDVVDDKNRFLPLELLFSYLSSHVGRKQYSIIPDLTIYLSELKRLGIDWHGIKSMDREDISALFKHLDVTHAAKAILLTALESKTCGVLCQGTSNSRHSTTVCLREGISEHGWRCGLDGHLKDVYFEGKHPAFPSPSSSLVVPKHSSAGKGWNTVEFTAGVKILVRDEPDFSIVGRFPETLNSRIWRAPDNPQFLIDVIGYEFRVHPNDPRVPVQIEGAASDWELHAQVTKQLLWEMLEMYGTEKDPQPLDLQGGEMGDPDCVSSYSNAFNTSMPATSKDEDGDVDDNMDGNHTVDSRSYSVEHRMKTKEGKEKPWFSPPPPQHFRNGIPAILPFAPSVVLKCSFEKIPRNVSFDEAERLLFQPVMNISVFVHPKACFFWNKNDEQRCIDQILHYAKRIPFALPFFLYFRVDSSRYTYNNPSIVDEKAAGIKEKEHFFDLRRFSTVSEKKA